MERPILFSVPMVRAILDGRKTQTRRVLKPQPKRTAPGYDMWQVENRHGGFICPEAEIGTLAVVCCPIAEGDELWVRESFATVSFGGAVTDGIYYKADVDGTHRFLTREGTWETHKDGQFHSRPDKWKPSIHMPRWASRITLRVTGVKVERLQDISDEDAKAEGIYYEAPTKEDYDWYETFCEENGGDPTEPMDGVWKCEGVKGWGPTPQTMYRLLWESINGPGSWDANPWVAAYTFERVLPK